MSSIAIKYVIKDTKLITIGVPLINAYTNKKGEIVANQKIYVEKIELLGKADNTQEFKIIDCETTTDFWWMWYNVL